MSINSILCNNLNTDRVPIGFGIGLDIDDQFKNDHVKCDNVFKLNLQHWSTVFPLPKTY